MLDVNVWSYLARRQEADTFQEFENRYGVETVLAPSMLLEALNTKDPAFRRAVVTAMADPPRTYLPTEAQTQATEVVRVVRTYRPEWLRSRPIVDRLPALENFWRHRVWQMARNNEKVLAERHADVRSADSTHEQLIEAQHRNKEFYEESKIEAKRAGERVVRLDALDDLFVTFTEQAPPELTTGWDGGRIEAWRQEIAAVWWHGLVTVPRRTHRTLEDSTLADWAEPWLKSSDIAKARASWNHLWYHEVDGTSVPRNWLQWAVFTAQMIGQSGRKAPGNPVDAQHAAYLLDADLFLTADRRYASVLNHVVRSSPVPVANVQLISAEAGTVDEIVRVVQGALP